MTTVEMQQETGTAAGREGSGAGSDRQTKRMERTGTGNWEVAAEDTTGGCIVGLSRAVEC